ncbi:hypothetical protein RHGRI_027183 [Rhododendron griersonianum]|uniref:Uncharacterized protein n=1 Tax=Rhododendron griersonianum TaxID=479676 RepID=A0AAV6IWZ7_9ERIC|nr:hypothetical protein RHGRI_027183 [Rhododendron griersonianum]
MGNKFTDDHKLSPSDFLLGSVHPSVSMLSSPEDICLDSDRESRLSEDNDKAPVPADEANKRRTTGASAEDDAAML